MNYLKQTATKNIIIYNDEKVREGIIELRQPDGTVLVTKNWEEELSDTINLGAWYGEKHIYIDDILFKIIKPKKAPMSMVIRQFICDKMNKLNFTYTDPEEDDEQIVWVHQDKFGEATVPALDGLGDNGIILVIDTPRVDNFEAKGCAETMVKIYLDFSFYSTNQDPQNELYCLASCIENLQDKINLYLPIENEFSCDGICIFPSEMSEMTSQEVEYITSEDSAVSTRQPVSITVYGTKIKNY